ncbi:MAG: hypothetical protein ABI550_08860, partial [Ignavibacteriaceae bacterium]
KDVHLFGRFENIEEIEERLKARAGNLPLKDSFIPKHPFQKDQKEEAYKTNNSNEQKIFGTGISEEEVKKIIDEFKL